MAELMKNKPLGRSIRKLRQAFKEYRQAVEKLDGR